MKIVGRKDTRIRGVRNHKTNRTQSLHHNFLNNLEQARTNISARKFGSGISRKKTHPTKASQKTDPSWPMVNCLVPHEVGTAIEHPGGAGYMVAERCWSNAASLDDKVLAIVLSIVAMIAKTEIQMSTLASHEIFRTDQE
jgi:hypothetical protein